MPRHVKSRLFGWPLGLLCLFAQLLIATAPLWHHHDHAGAAPDECSVCAAVLCSSTGDVPAAPIVAAPAPLVEVLVCTVESDNSVITFESGLARGPPGLGGTWVAQASRP